MTRDISVLASFAAGLRSQDIPAALLDKLRATLLHDLGMGLAGHQLSARARAVATSQGQGPAHLLVSGEAVRTEDAILANASMIHARTQEDTQLMAQTHLGSTAVPALLALGEELDSSGSDLLVAMLAAYEVTSHLGRDMAALSTGRGLRASSIFGSLATATGAARLLGCNATETAHAIGLAAAFGGGTAQTWVAGTAEWQYQVGAASRSGVLAARLAAAGVDAAPDSMTGTSGFYRAFCGEVPALEDSVPGEPWLTFEVTYKAFPVCAINQTPLTYLIDAMEQHTLVGDDITAISLHLAPSDAAYPGTDAQPPVSGVGAALMSAPLSLAIAMRHGTLTRALLERYDEPELDELAARVKIIPDAQLSSGHSRLVITTTDGRTIDTADGEQLAPFDWTFDEVAERLSRIAAELPLDGAGIEKFVNAVAAVEDASVRELVAATLC
jgi:2-methylcitrate dehydratase PrpD